MYCQRYKTWGLHLMVSFTFIHLTPNIVYFSFLLSWSRSKIFFPVVTFHNFNAASYKKIYTFQGQIQPRKTGVSGVIS